MTTRTGRFSLKPIAALLLGAAYVAVLPPVAAQTPATTTVQTLQERAATGARNSWVVSRVNWVRASVNWLALTSIRA
jgi:hypothetical protein